MEVRRELRPTLLDLISVYVRWSNIFSCIDVNDGSLAAIL